VIAVDANILARFYCEDPDDPEAKRQRPAARRVIVDSTALFVPLTVVLELEWVMRGFYEVGREAFCAVMDHLLGIGHVTVERWEAVKDAVEFHRTGLYFADALHLSTSRGCDSLLSFDRSFVRAVARSGVKPAVSLPG
jgi:predicted nucleic-acid-binding protein